MSDWDINLCAFRKPNGRYNLILSLSAGAMWVGGLGILQEGRTENEILSLVEELTHELTIDNSNIPHEYMFNQIKNVGLKILRHERHENEFALRYYSKKEGIRGWFDIAYSDNASDLLGDREYFIDYFTIWKFYICKLSKGIA